MEKIDDYTVKVTNRDGQEMTMTIAYLKQQQTAIENQKAKQIEQRDKELLDIANYLSEMEELGIIEEEVKDDIT